MNTEPRTSRTAANGSGDERLAHYREVLQAMYDAMLICDREGRVRECNSRAEKLLRTTADQLLGHRLTELVMGFQTKLLERIERRLAAGRFTVLEAYCVRRDETTFPAEIVIGRLPDNPAGEFLISIRNIEWRRKTEEAIRREVEAQMEKARAQDDFSGYLNILSIMDVLQLIEASRKSGFLSISDAEGRETASVEVRDGQIVRARCGDRTGDAAVYEMVRQGGAAFYFRQGLPEGRDPDITQTTMGLLLEASRRVDEERAKAEGLDGTPAAP